MRLFIAINFDTQTVNRMLDVQRRLKALGTGNFSRPENLHLTLAFLGEVAPERMTDLRGAMDGCTVLPTALTFDHVGRFKRDGGDVWWLGLKENARLRSLQQDLSERLADAGFLIERRRFSPHITLAREVRLTARADSGLLLGEPFTAQADAISLMRSERVTSRLTYTELYQKGPTLPEHPSWVLETARLGFRRISPSDHAALRPILGDAQTMYAWEYGFDDAQIAQFIQRCLARYQNDGYAYFAAIDKATGALAGLMGPLNEDIDGDIQLGLGYILAKDYWGRGYAAEGAGGWLGYAFHTLGAARVIASIRPENTASRRVAERLGLRVAGQHVKRVNGKEMLHLVYAIDKTKE